MASATSCSSHAISDGEDGAHRFGGSLSDDTYDMCRYRQVAAREDRQIHPKNFSIFFCEGSRSR
jgi:hypothetical protein